MYGDGFLGTLDFIVVFLIDLVMVYLVWLSRKEEGK